MKNRFSRFFIFFGIVFGGIPLTAFITLVASGENVITLLPMLLFAVVGIVFIVIGIKSLVQEIKEKKAMKYGILSTGKFVEEKNIGSMNNVPYFTLTFSYKNQNGEDVIYKSGATFTRKQLDYYIEKQTFDIKYYNNIATIVEKPFEKKYDSKTLEDDTKICAYCESIIDKKDKKCPYCGATNRK